MINNDDSSILNFHPLYFKLRWSNGKGNSSAKECSSLGPFSECKCTGILPQNSHNNCRHAPHGEVSTSASVTIAISEKSSAPSLSAFHKATRSAQMLSPYETFSILQPV